MTENTNRQATPRPSAALKQLDVLVGTWDVSGPDIQGQVRYAWLEGGFFLIQHVDFNHGGHTIKGMEIIGQERGFGATEPTEEITSRWYDAAGNTFQYTYEVDGDTLTIWGGERGSPAYYRGTFNADRNVNSGTWVYPGGGGYDSTMTRVG
ncbi:MAG: hypothetical protein AVDCRST_MAG18-644 [uncultured Thermomicrobiales bacterium]|uniref:DUF1579 domain-containing protein n=1 Tax=uncultured Thermomicrobiales bacterium TaxID=1645740 RepID=A0A6J4UNA0_9BACT|nr:MAG: hypothetical protein AVDCRST_MAG18-644 [uncultured Thermomicrobiales bacterium]